MIALVGNPNSGKTSLFNALTGLNQKVGNFSGVTVEKKIGKCVLAQGYQVNIIDLPGIYSLTPNAEDEQIAVEVLLNPSHSDKPQAVVIVVDASNLKRNLLLASQIKDLGYRCLIALTMVDIADMKQLGIDTKVLEEAMGMPVVEVNPRKEKGIRAIKAAILSLISEQSPATHPCATDKQPTATEKILHNRLLEQWPHLSAYHAWHIYSAPHQMRWLDEALKKNIQQLVATHQYKSATTQAEDVMNRYQWIHQVVEKAFQHKSSKPKQLITDKADRILLHPIWGNLILFTVLLLLFQSIFWLAAYPMDWIDANYSSFTNWIGSQLPHSWWASLLVDGLLAGIGGIIIFIPQIMILFGLITILEDSGYMARISFLTDRWMRTFGLNGRSIVPLIGGMACAVPAIMSARSIQNTKDRLITLFVTPLMSCSARLPVYTILIALVIPNEQWGPFNLQGLVMFGLYALGIVLALCIAYVMKWLVRTDKQSIFIMELPVYKWPRWKSVLYSMYERAKIFTLQAGKIILLISFVLWGLSSYGPGQKMAEVETEYDALIAAQPNDETLPIQKQHALLEHSYAGHFGKWIEPAIEPLGYDWKIGIALLMSFAAREVFVGTMATLYSVHDSEENDLTLRTKMQQAQKADGSPVYTLATGMSLLIFYAIALQCMSTLAIVRRETQSWWFAIGQFVAFGLLAYALAYVAYQALA